MSKYLIEFIPGTQKWVNEELTQKHPEATVETESENEITITADEEIDSFSDILTALRITKEGDKNALNLYRREWRKEFVAAGINPALAYVICKIANIDSHDILLDPFCGGGTIPITAKLYFDAKQIIASDISGKAIDITQNNLERAKINKAMIFKSDVAKLRLGKESVTKVVTNLPFGIRERSHDKNIKIYRDFAKITKNVLKKEGIAVILTQEIKLIQEIFKESGFKKIGDYTVKQGGLTPHIFVFKKL